MKIICVLFALISISFVPDTQAQRPAAKPKVSVEGQKCLDCHTGTTPGVVEQWRVSAHAKVSVDCYSCHKANANDPATFDHYGQRIAVIVTPNYCVHCHAKEVEQFEKSHHAMAAQFIGSLDNV